MSMDASTLGMPSPDRVTTPAEFVAALRKLRERAELSYRELESRAHAVGDRLPRNAIVHALSSGGVPREETIASFVRACGGDRSAVEVWLAARRRVAPAEVAVVDLASAVEAWVAAHLPARSADHSTEDLSAEDLAAAVEAWLTARRAEDPSPLYDADGRFGSDFEQGRLGEAVAQSTSNRWIGLHRRKSDRTRLLRRLTGGSRRRH